MSFRLGTFAVALRRYEVPCFVLSAYSQTIPYQPQYKIDFTKKMDIANNKWDITYCVGGYIIFAVVFFITHSYCMMILSTTGKLFRQYLPGSLSRSAGKMQSSSLSS
jgi:hypothetical protein